MTARRYTPDQLGHARAIRVRHVPTADGRTCAGCGLPYPCLESSRTAFVLADTAHHPDLLPVEYPDQHDRPLHPRRGVRR